jgi:hypothetical protein
MAAQPRPRQANLIYDCPDLLQLADSTGASRGLCCTEVLQGIGMGGGGVPKTMLDHAYSVKQKLQRGTNIQDSSDDE